MAFYHSLKPSEEAQDKLRTSEEPFSKIRLCSLSKLIEDQLPGLSILRIDDKNGGREERNFERLFNNPTTRQRNNNNSPRKTYRESKVLRKVLRSSSLS